MGERMFPMQRGPDIPWALAEVIYAGYSRMFGTQQSLERLAERGGFGWAEVEYMWGQTSGVYGKDGFAAKRAMKARQARDLGEEPIKR